MKTAAIAVLIIAVGLMTFDDQSQRAKSVDAQKNAADAQAQAALGQTQINAQAIQIGQLKAQLAAVQSQKASLVAAAAPTPTPFQPAPATTPQPVLPSATQIVENYSNALAIVEGKNGVGSGFLCNMDGHTYVITNAHVLCDNPELKITSVKGTVFNIGASAVAVAHDVVRLEVTGAQKSFDMMDNADSSVKIGDAIVILGNPEGAGVVKPVEGKIVGLGPDLIEVDAPFVKGNSGSPIIHEATGKVLGVATYIVERKMDQTAGGSVQNEVRRFGYRLDSIKQWQPINWQAFYAQSAQLTAMETLSEDFVKMFGDAGGGLNFDPNSYASPALQRSIRMFAESVQEGGGKMSLSDKKILVERFIADLRSVSHADILAFNRNTAYDYFQREVDDQAQFRDEIYQGLTRALENIR